MTQLGPVIADVLKELEPVGEADSDVLSKKERHREILSAFSQDDKKIKHFAVTDTRTHTIEGTYDDEIMHAQQSDEARDTSKSKAKRCHCNCFGGLFGKRK